MNAVPERIALRMRAEQIDAISVRSERCPHAIRRRERNA
jgi:hypothetical protein